MMVDISVVCTADHFQHYAPLFAYCMHKSHPQYRCCIAVMGELDDFTKVALSHIPDCQIREIGDEYVRAIDGVVVTEKFMTHLPLRESTANTCRWLFFLEHPNDINDNEIMTNINGVFCTDIDMLYLPTGNDVIAWHQQQSKEIGSCWYGHHGPWKKPRRFPEGWTGDRERVAGGAVYFGKEWFDKTESIRQTYIEMISKGVIGTYREEDEVVLANICKQARLWMPTGKSYPTDFRGIHLGDFKESMTHRWTNLEKMVTLLTDANCMRYREMEMNDPVWCAIRDICCNDPIIKKLFENLDTHLKRRGL